MSHVSHVMFLIIVHWHDIGTSQVAHHCLAVDRQKLKWHDCQLGMVEDCLESSLLRSFHIKCGKQSLNLQAEVNGDPIILEKAMHGPPIVKIWSWVVFMDLLLLCNHPEVGV